MRKLPPMGTNLSENSMIEATKGRARFSGHGDALGAAGVTEEAATPESSAHISTPGESLVLNAKETAYADITIGASWENIKVQKSGLFGKLMNKTLHKGVDLDLGCLYELNDGTRGAIQAFGDKYGDLDNPPYIKLSGDDRTGNAKGYDETIRIHPEHWQDIARMLIYIYIYDGAPCWADVRPRITLDVPGEEDLIVSLGSYNEKLGVCAVGGLENVRGGIRLTNYTEYFPGHEEMDRAFGFGLDWGRGKK